MLKIGFFSKGVFNYVPKCLRCTIQRKKIEKLIEISMLYSLKSDIDPSQPQRKIRKM